MYCDVTDPSGMRKLTIKYSVGRLNYLVSRKRLTGDQAVGIPFRPAPGLAETGMILHLALRCTTDPLPRLSGCCV